MASAKSLVNLKVSELLKLTASPLPTPGGGSAAALAGALAAALVEKIARKTARRERRALRLAARASVLRVRFTRAVQEDAHWYWRVVIAFRKRNHRAALRALVRATAVPKGVVADARQVISLLHQLKPLSAKVWHSDLQCAWLLAEAAQGAGLALIIANQQFMAQWSKRHR